VDAKRFKSTITGANYSRIDNLRWIKTCLIFDISAYTRDNRPKTSGGDVFVAQAVEDQGGARTFGVVTDHDNGTYTAQLYIH